METNQIIPQTDSAQTPTAESAFKSPLAQEGALYNVAEAKRIVRYLTTEGLFDPEYILLFGSLAASVPHSEAKCYDLLVVMRDRLAYNWWQAKHDLRYKLPFTLRAIPYINLYVMPLSAAKTPGAPFLYFAHRDGVLLYCRDAFPFRRPKRCIDFGKHHYNASTYYDTFKTLADSMMDAVQTERRTQPEHIRRAAYMTAQAATIYYRVLYYVYHGDEFGSDDLTFMHERMRTLSTELMLLFDDTHIDHNTTLSSLRRAALGALSSRTFSMTPDELEKHIGRIVRMGDIVARCCLRRLELYKLSIQQ